MEKNSKITAILIPGANPKVAEELFMAIKNELKTCNYNIAELETANEDRLISIGKELKSKVIIGKSLGGRFATYYQLNHQDARALVLLAPAMRGNEKFMKIEIPVLIIHGTNDSTIPVDNSRNLINYFKNGKLEEIENTGHGFTGNLEKVAKMISNWFGSLNL